MRIYILPVYLLFISTCSVQAQSKMTIDTVCTGGTYYEEHSKNIHSLSELPANILKNAEGYLKMSMGTLYSSVKYSTGQVIDKENYFKKDSIVYSMEWIVPKYDLLFSLQDTSSGIKNYCIRLKLDDHGQILRCNWPRKGYADIKNLKPLYYIKKIALRHATNEGYNVENYTVSFKYNEKLDALCWVFEYPVNSTSSDVIEIDWKNSGIASVYKIKRFTVY